MKENSPQTWTKKQCEAFAKWLLGDTKPKIPSLSFGDETYSYERYTVIPSTKKPD